MLMLFKNLAGPSKDCSSFINANLPMSVLPVLGLYACRQAVFLPGGSMMSFGAIPVGSVSLKGLFITKQYGEWSGNSSANGSTLNHKLVFISKYLAP
ncbi:hypothetical protein DK150_540006 [Flavobacterium psychrophilum]|nr:hypothetical protein DK150_540006 [Flavobacterium psychrophilum]